jgi:hypothetical protein
MLSPVSTSPAGICVPGSASGYPDDRTPAGQASRGISDDVHGHPNVQVPRGTFSFLPGHPCPAKRAVSGMGGRAAASYPARAKPGETGRDRRDTVKVS